MSCARYDRSVQVDREGPPVGVERQLERRLRLVDAGHGGEHVDRAAGRLDRVDERGKAFRVREIRPELDPGRDVDARDARPFGAKAVGDRFADSIRGTGDERVPALEQAHAVSRTDSSSGTG